MVFLITTLFIAELVLFLNIVMRVISVDDKVRVLLNQTEINNIKLEKRLKALRQITADLNEIMPYLIKKIEKKRNRLIIVWLKNLLQSGVLLFFKPKYKKLLLGLKLGAGVIKDLSKV